MEKYQIVEVTEQLNHAGTKATADIADIAEKLGFKRINVKMDTTEESIKGKAKRQVGYFRDWQRAEKVIAPESILLLQHPFHYKQITRDKTLRRIKSKNVKIISVVHDVEELRAFRYNDYYRHEFEVMLELADVIVVHNSVMKQWFVERGFKENKLISLEIFDYLQTNHTMKVVRFEKSVTVAGNLDTTKCGYISELGKLKDVKVHLYGPNFNDELRKLENIEYHGSFPVNEIPKRLDRGFGLVWDGESIDGCKGLSGQYLRYNNPHKLSLYLSSGIPVVIWKEAAEANFVEKNGVGIAVGSLLELTDLFKSIQPHDYDSFVENVNELKAKLQNGEFALNALNRSISII